MKNRPWTDQGARRGRGLLAQVALSTALTVSAVATLAQTATDATTILTLPRAIDAAWQRQPEALSIGQRREAAEAKAAATRRWTAEPMALELLLKTDRLTNNNGGREIEAGVSAQLWLPGERERSLAVAQAEQTAVDGRVAAARWRIAGAVREAWWAVQLARQEAQAIGARLAAARQLAADVARRVAAGDLARADQHQADSAVAGAEAELAQAGAAESQALQALRGLIGTPTGANLQDAAESTPDLDAAQALASHPLLRELRDKAELARRARELAGVQRRTNPELALSTARERGAYGESYGQSISIGLRFPFGGGERHRASLATATADQTEAEALTVVEAERLVAEIEAARARVAGARQAAEASERRAALARDTRGFFEKSFRLGESDLPTRLRTAAEAFDAERQAARARVAQAQAVSAWRQALGLLPEQP